MQSTKRGTTYSVSMICLLITLMLSACAREVLVDPTVPVQVATPTVVDCWVPDRATNKLLRKELEIPAGKLIIDRTYWKLKKAEGDNR